MYNDTEQHAEAAPKSIADELAQFIRQVDGNHKMGAGSLADKICERFRVDAPDVQWEPVAWLRFRSHRVAADDVIEGLEMCEPGETGDDGGPAFPVYTAPQPAGRQPVPVFSDEDHVSMPRGLIAAACSAIDKKRDAENVLSELRRYTLGDLSRQTEPDVDALIEALEEIIQWTERWVTADHPVAKFGRKALAAYRKQETSHDNQ